MKKFEFKQRQPQYLHLDIAGNKFSVPFTSGFAAKCIIWGKTARELAESLEENPEEIAEANSFMKQSLDEILGQGATNQIFENREFELDDSIDIMNYIMEQVKELSQPEPEPVAPEQASVETAMKILQNPEVMQAITKAMQK